MAKGEMVRAGRDGFSNTGADMNERDSGCGGHHPDAEHSG